MYLRFIAYERRWLRSNRRGLFVASYRFRHRWRLGEVQAKELQSTLKWFAKELPIPDDSAFPNGNGRCWFKPEARLCIERMWRLSALLAVAGVRTGQVYNRDPGRITYQDDFQIVAVDKFVFRR